LDRGEAERLGSLDGGLLTNGEAMEFVLFADHAFPTFSRMIRAIHDIFLA
jgi:hypothetical protein